MGLSQNLIRKRKPKTRHFIAWSAVLHLAAALGFYFISTPFIQRTQNDIISVDFEAQELTAPQGEQVLPTQGSQPEEPVQDVADEEFQESLKDDFGEPDKAEVTPPPQETIDVRVAKTPPSADYGRAQAEGKGAGNTGLVGMGNKTSGTSTGIRSLEQIRQAPGNPKPKYDLIERRRGDTGEVIFIAYINQKGVPEKFKLAQSTGHRNLDLKALVALKKWRFQPGQEGWVEVPFKWDLRGNLKTEGGLLRRDRRASK